MVAQEKNDGDKKTETKEEWEHRHSKGAERFAKLQLRIQSISRVLAHYEDEHTTPFSIFGINITRDFMTLVGSDV